jgi:hypothetical protein
MTFIHSSCRLYTDLVFVEAPVSAVLRNGMTNNAKTCCIRDNVQSVDISKDTPVFVC